ncbi:MAG: hypothetical protein K8T91_05230 [Planctomycetes bacterium]|nr:hypothetical protein [Planctomycetota bacterium]
MSMQPYRIHCLTCSAPLKIDDPSLVGEIFNCPKCFSMVLVTPPPDAIAPAPSTAMAPPKSPKPAANPKPSASPKTAAPPKAKAPSVASASQAAPPVVAPPVASAATAPALAAAPWKKWLILSGSGVAGVVLTLGVWFVATRSGGSPPLTAKVDTADKTPDHAPGATSKAAIPTDKNNPPLPLAAYKVEAKLVPVASPEKLPPASAPPTSTGPAPVPPLPESKPAQGIDESAAERKPENRVNDTSSPTPPKDARTPPPPVSVPSRPIQALSPPSPALTARLALPLAGIKMPATPLRVLLDTIGALGAVKIQCDGATLGRVGMTLDDPATVEIQAASLAEVLGQVLKSHGLTFVATGDRVVVTVPGLQDAPLARVRYAVEDLEVDNGKLTPLADLIRTVVHPKTWQSQGGRAKLAVVEGALVVEQSAEAHWQILQLCEKLRVARGLATRSRIDSEWLVPQLRSNALAGALGRKVSVQAADGVPLTEIVRLLAARGGVAIEIDELSLARYGINPQAKAKIHIEDLPLPKTLDQLLTPLGLAWQPIGPKTLSITTSETLRSSPMVEVYSFGQNAKAGEAMVAKLRREVAPGSWLPDGGEGIVVFDSASRALVVSQPYPIQVQVEAALK